MDLDTIWACSRSCRYRPITWILTGHPLVKLEVVVSTWEKIITVLVSSSQIVLLYPLWLRHWKLKKIQGIYQGLIRLECQVQSFQLWESGHCQELQLVARSWLLRAYNYSLVFYKSHFGPKIVVFIKKIKRWTKNNITQQ